MCNQHYTDNVVFARVHTPQSPGNGLVCEAKCFNLAQVYAALPYVAPNREEIDQELEAEMADFVRLKK